MWYFLCDRLGACVTTLFLTVRCHDQPYQTRIGQVGKGSPVHFRYPMRAYLFPICIGLANKIYEHELQEICK